MENIQRTYLPAAGKNWTLPLYDPLVKLLGVEGVRATFLDQAALHTARRVLDIGCGTFSIIQGCAKKGQTYSEKDRNELVFLPVESCWGISSRLPKCALVSHGLRYIVRTGG